MLSEDQLAQLPRREIQAIAKEHGIKANMKTALIIEQLLLLDSTTTSPAQVSPGAAPVASVSTDDKLANAAEDAASVGGAAATTELPSNTQPISSSSDDTVQETDTQTPLAQEAGEPNLSSADTTTDAQNEDNDVDLTSPEPTTGRSSITASTYKAASRIFREAECELRSARRSSIVPRVPIAATSAPRRGHSQAVQGQSARARMSTPRVPGATPLSARGARTQRPTPVAAPKAQGAAKASVFDLAASLRRKPSWQMKLTKPAPRPVLSIQQASRENTYANAKARRRREAMQTYSNRGGAGGKRVPLGLRAVNE